MSLFERVAAEPRFACPSRGLQGKKVAFGFRVLAECESKIVDKSSDGAEEWLSIGDAALRVLSSVRVEK